MTLAVSAEAAIPPGSEDALRVVAELGVLGQALEAAARERRVPDINRLLERRQGLLDQLLGLVRDGGVALNEGVLGQQWCEVLEQDGRAEQAMIDSMVTLKKKLRRTRQKMQANATYFRPTRPAPCNFLDIRK